MMVGPMRSYLLLCALVVIGCPMSTVVHGDEDVEVDGDGDLPVRGNGEDGETSIPDGDADSDADVDADSDSDSDSDSDVDSDGDSDADNGGYSTCANTDEVCSEASSCCNLDRTTCAGASDETPRCYQNCTPTDCDYGDESGTCIDAGGIGLCLPATRDPATSNCTGDPCETEYRSPNGICASDGTVSYCLEECTLTPSGCLGTHVCVPLVDGGGVCVPAG